MGTRLRRTLLVADAVACPPGQDVEPLGDTGVKVGGDGELPRVRSVHILEHEAAARRLTRQGKQPRPLPHAGVLKPLIRHSFLRTRSEPRVAGG